MSEPRPNGDATRPDTDQTHELVTVAEAAARLGISTDAVRMRVRRGTLPSDERDGRRLVLVPRSDTDATRPDSDQTPTEHRPNAAASHATTAPEPGPNATELIDQLRSEVSYLRQTLDAEIEARRRADHLVAGMIEERHELTARIAALDAGATEPRSDTDATATERAIVASEPMRHASDSLALTWRRWWQRVRGR